MYYGEEPGLAMGELIGLTSSHRGVAASARRRGDDVIVITANLGTTAARNA